MLNLAKCRSCGRVFKGPADATLCGECLERRESDLQKVEDAVAAEDMRSPREIAMDTDLPLDTVRNILHSSKVLGSQTRSDELCGRCRQRVSLGNSDYCLSCQLTLVADLKKSFEELSESASQNPQGKDAPQGVRASLAAKRRRTGSHRFGQDPPTRR